jgi:hypothetical protein
VITQVGVLDEILGAHARSLGDDFVSYRNHVYRVVNLSLRLHSANGDALRRLAIAAAFHDLGIWTAGTFDYLRPSMALAKEYLIRSGQPEWVAEVSALILEHHKILPYRGMVHPLVESFRKADWIDVTRGLLTFGIPRRFVAELYRTWPSAGFHRRLVQLAAQRFRSNPWTPLPMVRL